MEWQAGVHREVKEVIDFMKNHKPRRMITSGKTAALLAAVLCFLHLTSKKNVTQQSPKESDQHDANKAGKTVGILWLTRCGGMGDTATESHRFYPQHRPFRGLLQWSGGSELGEHGASLALC